ncbi:unnamed protein product [Ixodes hexagonus]
MTKYQDEDAAEKHKRRDLPPPGWKRHSLLLALKGLDEAVSQRLFLAADEQSPLADYRQLLCSLERSAHAVVWFGGLAFLLWFFSMDVAIRTFLFNIFLALTIDVIVVAVLKATARRRRPGISREEYEADPSSSNLSFPSGFVSRAVLVTLIVVEHSHLFPLFKLPFVFWCMAVTVTKLLMGRQFLGDSLAGFVLGYFEYHLVACPLWLSQDVVSYLFSSFDVLGDGVVN